VSRVEERDRLLDAVARDAQVRDTRFRARRSEPTRRASWASGTALLVLVAAAAVAVAPPAFLQGGSLPFATPEDLMRGTETRLLLQAWQVEVFRERQGKLPDSLGQVGTVLSGVRYIRSDARVFQLVATGPRGEPVVYDSALPGGGLGSPLVLPGDGR